jgi:hypothetical protein
MLRIKKILLGCIVLFGLHACSTFGFIFERLDWLNAWQLDSMFDLNSEQEEEAERLGEYVREWLRNDAFPRWIIRGQSIQQTWREGDLQGAVEGFESLSQSAWKETLAAITKEVWPLLGSVSKPNTDYYREYTEDNFSEWFEPLESSEAKRERLLERLDEWFGDLNDEQLRLLDKNIAVQPNERKIRIDNSRHWRELFITAALEKDNQALATWLTAPETWWLEEYKQLRAQNRAMRLRFFMDLLPTLSDKQRQHADDTMQEWIDAMAGVLPVAEYTE